MSMVIKGPEVNGAVRRFVAPSRILQAELHGAAVPDLPAEALRQAEDEKEALAREVDELKRALAAAAKAASEAERNAREEGRQEGREAAEAADAERLAALAAGLAAMTGEWTERLDGLDGLAASIARSSLSKLFDSWDEASEFVTRTIARQIRLLRREAIVAIRVSCDDFPDEQALAALASGAGTGSLRILVDPDLAAGECRADLQLGHIDLGVRAQQAQLASLLDSLAANGGAA